MLSGSLLLREKAAFFPSRFEFLLCKANAMRTFNVRLAGLLLVGTGFLAVGAWAFHDYQVRRNAAVLLREAAVAREHNDLNQAIDFLQRYVSLTPRGNTEPLAELGLLQADMRRPMDAFRTLERVLRQDSSRSKERRRLVEVAVALGRHADARHHVEILLKHDPNDVGLLIQLAKTQAAMNEPEAAARSLRQAIETEPEVLENHALLAELTHKALSDPLGAIDILDRLVLGNPESAKAYVIRGTHWLDYASEIEPALERKNLLRSKQTAPADALEAVGGAETEITAKAPLARALDDARAAETIDPKDEAVVMLLIRCLLKNELDAEAAGRARQAVEQFPGNAFVYGALAEFERKRGDVDAAISWYEKGLQRVPGDRDLLWNLADCLLDAERISDARQRLRQLERTDYPRAPIVYLDSKSLAIEEKWQMASHQLEVVRPALIEWPDLTKQADFWLGKCYEQLGRGDMQLTAYQRAAGVDARWAPARIGLAQTLAASGKFDEAFQEYAAVANMPGAPAGVFAELARISIARDLRRKPSEQKWDVSERLLSQLEERNEDPVVVDLLRAELLIAQNKILEAETKLAAARDRSPDSIELWLGLVTLAESRNDTENAKQLLADARRTLEDSVELRLAEARHLALYQKPQAQAGLRELSKNLGAFDKKRQTELKAGLAVWTLVIGDDEECRRLCMAVAEEQPANLRVRLLLFDLALRANDPVAMKSILKEVYGIEQSGPLWHYGEAVRLVLEARREGLKDFYEEAKRHLLDAQLARPAWSRIPALLAQIDHETGDEEAEIANLTEAIRLGEHGPEIVNRAVMLLYQRQRLLEADQIIRNLEDQTNPFSPELAQIATEVSLQLHDRERTLRLVEQAEWNSNDPQRLVWAGRILSVLDEDDRAEQTFRKAIGIDEKSSEAWVALIQHLGRRGRKKEAEQAIAEAGTKIPTDKAPLALAQAYESLGEYDEAESYYVAVLNAEPDDISMIRRATDFWMRRNQPQTAQPLLQRVLEGKQSTEDDRSWSRRNLAVVLLSAPSAANLEAALALVETNLTQKHNLKSAPDRRAKALILSKMPDPAAIREAAEILEKVLQEKQPDSHNEEPRFLLASLYVKLKDDSSAVRHMQILLEEHGDVPRDLAWYAGYLISRGKISEAELWVDRLSQADGKSYQTLKLTSEIRFARDQHQQLLAGVDDHLSNFAGSPEDRGKLQRQAALLLEDFGRRIESEAGDKEIDENQRKLARRYLEAATTCLTSRNDEVLPAQQMALAAFYARNEQVDAALDLLERNYRTALPEDIAATGASLLAEGAANPEQLSKLEHLLEKSLRYHDGSLVLVLALADHTSWTGNFVQAESYYREALRREPDQIGALNNLAVLMALQGQNEAESLALIEQAISKGGLLPMLLDSRGTVRLTLGEADQAVEDLQRAIELRPDSGSYFRLALAEMKCGKPDAARDAWDKAQQLGLKEVGLHPLERAAYRQLQTAWK